MGLAELAAGIGVVITIIFSLHKITSENVSSLQNIMAERIQNLEKNTTEKIDTLKRSQEQEAERLREGTNKTESRLGETTLRAETKMKEEADKVREQFLANNTTIKNEMDIRFREVHRMIESLLGLPGTK